MKYTNLHSIPETIVKAVIGHPRKIQDGFSVTELVKSPRQLQLERRHDAELEMDISECLWRLLGSAVHTVIDKHSTDIEGIENEGTVATKINGIHVHGRYDLYEPNKDGGVLNDYKVTSVWSFMDGVKKEWEHQLNYYAVILRENGFEVTAANIYAILRDWTKNRVFDKGYPPCPFLTAKVNIYKHQAAKELLVARVVLHQAASELPDDKLPDCTPEEQWARPAQYAVKKRGNKKATRCFDTEKEAERYIYEQSETAKDAGDEPEDYLVEYRPGARVKCEGYCSAAPICSQFKKETEANQPF